MESNSTDTFMVPPSAIRRILHSMGHRGKQNDTSSHLQRDFNTPFVSRDHNLPQILINTRWTCDNAVLNGSPTPPRHFYCPKLISSLSEFGLNRCQIIDCNGDCHLRSSISISIRGFILLEDLKTPFLKKPISQKHSGWLILDRGDSRLLAAIAFTPTFNCFFESKFPKLPCCMVLSKFLQAH